MLSDPLILTFSIVCLAYAVRGACFGLAKVLLRIGALAGAYLCAYLGYPPVSAVFSQHSPIELPAALYHALAACVCLLTTFLLFNTIAACIQVVINRLVAKYPPSLLTTFVTRIAAALLSCAFSFGLCLGGLVSYQILSEHFPLPKIRATKINETFIKWGEHWILRMQADDIPGMQTEESEVPESPAPKIQPQLIPSNDASAPSDSSHPKLIQHKCATQENNFLEHALNHPRSQAGQGAHCIPQRLAAEDPKKWLRVHC